MTGHAPGHQKTFWEWQSPQFSMKRHIRPPKLCNFSSTWRSYLDPSLVSNVRLLLKRSFLVSNPFATSVGIRIGQGFLAIWRPLSPFRGQREMAKETAQFPIRLQYSTLCNTISSGVALLSHFICLFQFSGGRVSGGRSEVVEPVRRGEKVRVVEYLETLKIRVKKA